MGSSAGGRPPLVLIHGFTSSARVWDPVVPLLREHHDVVAVAMDGHRGGRTFDRRAPPDAAYYADGVERDMDAAGIGRAHLVGNSLGGWVALLLAARGRAESVVCLAPAGGWRPGSLFERRLLLTFAAGYVAFGLLAPSARSLMRRPRARWLATRSLVADPGRLPARVAAEMVEDTAACSALLPTVMAYRRQPLSAFDAVPGRVRIAWSGEDRVLPERRARARFAELVPAAEQLVVPGVGHVPMWDDPALVARTITEVTTAEPAASA
jgi:pimeloyl-ACP methyl ester carboxylesterase